MPAEPELTEDVWNAHAVLTCAGKHGREVVFEGRLADVVSRLTKLDKGDAGGLLISMPERRLPPYRFDDFEFRFLLSAFLQRDGGMQGAIAPRRVRTSREVWDEADILTLREMVAAGKSKREIASALNRSAMAVASQAVRVGISFRRPSD